MNLRLRAGLWRCRHAIVACAFIAALAAILTTIRGLTPEVTTAVVAARDLSPGTRLESGDLREATIPTSLAPAGGLASADSLEGEVLTTAVPAGSPLSRRHVLSNEFLTSAPEGTRIVPIEVDATGVGTLVTPGESVALYAPPDKEDQREAIEVVARAVVVGVDAPPENSSFNHSDSSDIVRLFVAIPENETKLLVGYGSTTSMRLVVRVDPHGM